MSSLNLCILNSLPNNRVSVYPNLMAFAEDRLIEDSNSKFENKKQEKIHILDRKQKLKKQKLAVFPVEDGSLCQLSALRV